MKKFNLYNLIFAATLSIFAFSNAKAQHQNNQTSAPNAAESKQNNPKIRRQKILAQLGLSGEQIQQIRRINADRKPLLRAAQERLRAANRNLDQAVYADTGSEAEMQSRIRETQAAQAEVIKIRATTEAEVRRVLTNEQLGRFREIRRQFVEQADERREQRQQMRRMDAPTRGLKNRQQRRQRRNANFISQ
ncbi:MAG: hypothetical protein H0U87_09545 [Acidobacteria bacterium]|jgi:Spy/CpxP family protein refolding chaperone|nr:hypothetical protein [Acidobacteriota bacterium]